MTKWRAYELIKGAPQGRPMVYRLVQHPGGCTLARLSHVSPDELCAKGARSSPRFLHHHRRRQAQAACRQIRGGSAGVTDLWSRSLTDQLMAHSEACENICSVC